MKQQRVYLVHIAECIRKIERDVAAGKAVFFGSETVQDAVLRNLQVMCESTRMLTAEWKAANAGVDWRRIADFRNRLVHEYLGIDRDLGWKVLVEDPPEQKRVIANAANDAEANGPL